MQNKNVGVPKNIKSNIKDKKEQVDLTFAVIGVVRFIEVAQRARQTIFNDKRQITDEQKYNLIKLEGRIEGYRDFLLLYLRLAPSWLNELKDKIISEDSFQDDVNKFIDGLVPVKNVLITDNINQEMSHIKQRKQVIGV